jgi:hypothetical protein
MNTTFLASICFALIASSSMLASAFVITSTTSTNHRSATATSTSLSIFNQKKGKAASASKLPKPDPTNPDRYKSPPTTTSSELYPPYLSLIRNGPLPLLTRLTNPDKYQQAIYKYQFESKETDLQEAQSNIDAFFSAPDVWAEQKLKEQRGEREVYMYNKELIPERVALSVVWASIVLFIVGKIVWKGILHF